MEKQKETCVFISANLKAVRPAGKVGRRRGQRRGLLLCVCLVSQ